MGIGREVNVPLSCLIVLKPSRCCTSYSDTPFCTALDEATCTREFTTVTEHYHEAEALAESTHPGTP